MKSTGDTHLSKDHPSFIKSIPEPIFFFFFFNHLDVSRGSFTVWHMMTLIGISVVPAFLILQVIFYAATLSFQLPITLCKQT